jgi:serine/threonine protein kinase
MTQEYENAQNTAPGLIYENQLLDGRFLIRRKLGSGNFGSVYLADQRIFGVRLRPVALKLFHTSKVGPENAGQIFNDAIILVRLQQEANHAQFARNLVSIYDAGFLHERPDQAYIAMEYVEGYSPAEGIVIHALDRMIRRYHPVPVELALYWMVQILRPLAWMHTLDTPILHGDLKPDNILVCGKDTLKVADFGLAQLTHGIFGTGGGGAISYQPPETLAGLKPTAASDVYSLGLLLYEILAGQNPLNAVGADALQAKRDEEYKNLQVQARRNGIPALTAADNAELADHPLLIEIVRRCLAFKASDRFTNAAGLLQAVEEYVQGKRFSLTPPPAEEREIPADLAPALTLERVLSEGDLFLRKGQLEEAQARYDQARQSWPQSAAPYWGLARVQLARRDWQETLKLCTAGRALEANAPEAFDLMADAYELGRQPGMVERLRAMALAAREQKRR